MEPSSDTDLTRCGQPMSDQPSAERIPGNKRSGYRGSAARKALETPALSHISQEATTTSSEVCDTKKQHEEEEATSVEAALEPAGCSMNPYISLVARRMRTLRKRIARIEASEKILSSDPQGKTKINPDQLQAVARKTEATAPLKELEELSKFMLAQYAKDRDANAATSTDHAQELERTKQQISQEHEDSSTVHFIHLISLFFVLKELEVAERILDPDLSRCLKTLRSFRSMLFEAASAAEMVGDEKHKVGLNMLVRNLAEATPEIADETDTFTFKDVHDALHRFTHHPQVLLKEARIKDDAENNMELAVSSVTATAEGMKMLENVGQHATQSRSPLSIQPVFMTGTETVITLEQRNAIHDSTTTSQPIEVPRDIPAANSKTSNTAPKSEIITEPLVLHSEDSHQQSYIVAVRPVHEYGFASGPWTVSGPQLVHPYPLHARPQLPQILTQSVSVTRHLHDYHEQHAHTFYDDGNDHARRAQRPLPTIVTPFLHRAPALHVPNLPPMMPLVSEYESHKQRSALWRKDPRGRLNRSCESPHFEISEHGPVCVYPGEEQYDGERNRVFSRYAKERRRRRSSLGQNQGAEAVQLPPRSLSEPRQPSNTKAKKALSPVQEEYSSQEQSQGLQKSSPELSSGTQGKGQASSHLTGEQQENRALRNLKEQPCEE